MSADGTGRARGRPLLESDVAEVLRRLKLHRDHAPKKIAAALGCHVNTICAVATGKHYLLSRARLAGDRVEL